MVTNHRKSTTAVGIGVGPFLSLERWHSMSMHERYEFAESLRAQGVGLKEYERQWRAWLVQQSEEAKGASK